MYMLVIDSPNRMEYLNILYEVPSCARMHEHIEAFKTDRPSPSEAINNVYKLTSI